MNKCKNCKWYQMDYENCCSVVDNHQESGTDFHIDAWSADDQGLEARLRVGPDFGCLHFEDRNLGHVPEKYLVESPKGNMYQTWGDITRYLKTDPHPEYRLVSVSLINGVTKYVWEFK